MAKAATAPKDDDDLNLNPDGQVDGDDQSDQDDQDDDQDDQSDDQDDQDDQDGDDDQEGQDEDDDQEIVLEGDDGSHPKDEQRGIRKRINKLNAKVAEAKTGQDQSTAALDVERERNRLLQLALDQQTGKPVDGPPDPNAFDNGVADAGYIKAFQDHIANGVRADMLKTQRTTHVQTQTDDALQARQVAHYKKADAIKVKDYDETEDKAIAVLGQDVTNQLISASDKSPELLYYLGKNPAKAEELAALIKSNPVKGVLRMGALEERLVTRPKAKRKSAPDPDGELSGGGSGKRKTKRGPSGAKFE